MSDQRIWLMQWLCQERHSAFALVFVPALGQTVEATEIVGWKLAHDNNIRNVCGICGKEIHPEAAPSRFILSQWDECMAAMMTSQTAQLASRAALDTIYQTVDSRRERQN
jgi:hypothetical protein